MKRQEVSKDGNCCFTSVSIGPLGSPMKTLHPELNFDSSEIMSQQLRQVAVKEWKENAEHYRLYVGNGDVCDEADKFKQLGYFSSDLGDSS